jgi:hypothetical protein
MQQTPAYRLVWLKPATPDLDIVDPGDLSSLPVTGRQVPLNDYWNRRILDGDVLLFDPDEKKGSKA